MDSMMETYLAAAKRVAKLVGDMVERAFHVTNKTTETKENFGDLVTQTDKEVEKFVFSELRKEFPGHHFIGEESVAAGNGVSIQLSDDPTWIIDPIDGTCNFVHRIPHTCISLALLIKKRTRVAVVFNPLTKELYHAVEGAGAFLNDQRIHVSTTKRLDDAIVIIDVWASSNPRKIECTMENMKNIVNKIRGFRSFGSGVLNMCFVARGISDVYLEYGIHCWDMAAASLIVVEAGGVVVDPTGSDFDVMRRRILCGSSTDIVKELLPILTHVDYDSEAVYV